MPMRFSVERVLDATAVPDLHQPTSLALDSQGNIVLCDRPRGEPAVSRLLASDGYRRQIVASTEALDGPPLLVRSGPQDTVYILCLSPDSGRTVVRRLSATGKREQPYPLPGTPADIAVDHEGKLWVMYRDRSQGLSLQAYGARGALAYDYEEAVEDARNNETVPPLFIEGQYVAVDPGGDIWFGAFLEQTSCVCLEPNGRWKYWDYPSSFAEARGFLDYTGLAAASSSTLLTTDFRAIGEQSGAPPVEQYLVEIDLEGRRLLWTSLADLGLPDMREPAEPSIWDLAWHDGRLYLCDYTYSRIIILRGDDGKPPP